MNTTNLECPDYILMLENRAFCVYLISSCILVLKMMLISVLTVRKRLTHKAFPSPEDAKFNKVEEVKTHDTVERMRRAHLNDLENITIFWAAGFAYLWTKPCTIVACFLYFGFTVARISHTIVYAVFVAPQPSRAICFFVGFLITGYMAIHSIIHGFASLF